MKIWASRDHHHRMLSMRKPYLEPCGYILHAEKGLKVYSAPDSDDFESAHDDDPEGFTPLFRALFPKGLKVGECRCYAVHRLGDSNT